MSAMGSVIVKIPLVTWREGRPRFVPGPRHRALGFRGEDLRHGRDGPWFTLDEAIEWSEKRQAEIDALAAKAGVPRKLGSPPATSSSARSLRAGQTMARERYTTVSQLCEAFLSSPRMAGRETVEGRRRRPGLAPATARSYRGAARLLERLDGGRLWLEAADAVTARALAGILQRVEVEHGLAQARIVRAFLSVVWRHGRAQKRPLVAGDPFAALEERLPVLPPRVRPASVLEFLTLVATADALGLPDLGDLVVAGAWTAQRQNDRLALPAAALTADGLLVEPSKKAARGERLLVPVSKMLAGRLAAARARRRDWPVTPFVLFACEATQRPWQPDWYRKCFRIVRHAAATGRAETGADGAPSKDAKTILGDLDVPASLAAGRPVRAGDEMAGEARAGDRPPPDFSGAPAGGQRAAASGAAVRPLSSLADLRDQDLRDTAASWAALAGCDRFEIAGLTGHAFGQSDRVLRHYVAVPPEFGRRAIAKMEAWFAGQQRAASAQR